VEKLNKSLNRNYIKILPGLFLSSFIALISIYSSNYLTFGSITIAILLGCIIRNLFNEKIKKCNSGIVFSETTLLNIAIILIASHMDMKIFAILDFYNIIFIFFLIISSIFISCLIGKCLGISKDLSVLIGIGNGICGSSAIASSSKVLGSKNDEIGISIATINTLGAFSIFLLPLFLLNFFPDFSDEQFGFIIGSSIQAFGQVTAAGFSINQHTGEIATIIKMIRILMLGPFILVLTFFATRGKNKKTENTLLFPKFIIGFIILSTLVSLSILPSNVVSVLQVVSKIILTISMAAIGLKISFKSLFNFGVKPILVSILAYIVQIIIVIIFVL